ncbi:MAG: hypothetical protein KDB14_08220 [Planctomycetales bacterium]|nr:hypothetical protein [Planctomycetales bacterium]
MTIGNSPHRAHAHAAPRRRFRTEDDAGYLGDAPILLNLPSLCGIPDRDGPTAEESGELDREFERRTTHETESDPSQDAPQRSVAGESDGAEHLPGMAADDHHATAAVEADSASDALPDRSKPIALATPEFVESAAKPAAAPRSRRRRAEEAPTTADSESEDKAEHLSEHRGRRDVEPAADEELQSGDEAETAKSGLHRKIILWTAVFVTVASLYMYVNRDRGGSNVASPIDAPDVEMGWETADAFNEPAFGDSFDVNGGADVTVDPTYSNEYPVPTTEATPTLQQTGGEAPPTRVPELNEAAQDWQQYNIRTSDSADYPRTAVPEAAYEVTEAPTGVRTSMRTDAGGATSSLDGISPVTSDGAAQ